MQLSCDTSILHTVASDVVTELAKEGLLGEVVNAVDE